ncbi:MAG: PhoH family protein [Candidatus Riflebacteria bacterium]|nr:PhoH family protein [Candidatus Riflebacteria bacterium]
MNYSESLSLSEELSRLVFFPETENVYRILKDVPEVVLKARGNQLELNGNPEKIDLIKKILLLLAREIEKKRLKSSAEAKNICKRCLNDSGDCEPFELVPDEVVIVSDRGSAVVPKTRNQWTYLTSIKENIVTLAKGPAGTGKTYLSVAMAVKALRAKEVSRLILSRPVIEAGESLGFLPGDIKEKVDPYFKPLYDCLQEFIGLSKFEHALKQGKIEITPLAYMRGRTFNNAFVVLDEAQNTTLMQMKMFLTRIGFGTKVVITGDHTQIDLPSPRDSSLHHLEKILSGIPSVNSVSLTSDDVIRHSVVKDIIEAFDTYSET